MKTLEVLQQISPKSWKYVGLLTPMLLGLAVAVSAIAFKQGVDVLKPTPKPNVQVAKEYLSGKQLAAVVERMKRENPNLEVLLSADGKTVAIKGKHIESYTDFMYALTTTPALERGVFWQAVSLCFNDCAGNGVVFAEIKGYKQNITGF